MYNHLATQISAAIFDRSAQYADVNTDPLRKDKLIGFVLKESAFSSKDVEQFLAKLKEEGIEPDQVVTDQSSLYPAPIKEIWPRTSHQLCLFHLSQKLTNAAKKAVKALKANLPIPPKNSSKSGADRSIQLAQVISLSEKGHGIKSIARDVGISKNTVKKWLRDLTFANVIQTFI